MTSRTTYTYKQIDGIEIRADFYTGSGEGLRPTIMYLHGGALIAGNRGMMYDEVVDLLTNNGYSIVSIDYRLAPETKLPFIIEDIEDAWRWLHLEAAPLRVDVGRLAVMGSSAGGYLALTAGYRFQPRPRVLVSIYGYGDLTGPWYSQPSAFYLKSPAVSEEEARAVVDETPSSCPGTDRGKFYLYCRQQGIWPEEVGGHDSNDAAWFADYEPLRNVTNTYPPTILLHGEADTDVPFEQSVLMRNVMEENGVPNVLISRSDWGHGFDYVGLKDEHVGTAYNEILGFLNTYIRGPFMSSGIVHDKS
ncbi:MAG: alpha/beta hydrolase [Gemmatimonadota bacterium]|nr:alpha/beta hydrolase [Gemmatimonadota bacterium]